MIDPVILILHWACLLCMGIVPLLVITRLLIYAVRAEQCHWNLLYRTIASMLIWIPVTLFIFLMLFFSALGDHEEGYVDPPFQARMTPGYTALLLGYLLVSAGTLYWIWREDKIKLP